MEVTTREKGWERVPASETRDSIKAEWHLVSVHQKTGAKAIGGRWRALVSCGDVNTVRTEEGGDLVTKIKGWEGDKTERQPREVWAKGCSMRRCPQWPHHGCFSV